MLSNRYNLSIAWANVRRAPYLSALMIFGLALGVALIIASIHPLIILNSIPVDQDGDQFFHVLLDNWDQNYAYHDSHFIQSDVGGMVEETHPLHMTWRDATALLESEIPLYQTATTTTFTAIRPLTGGGAPEMTRARLCTPDFFPMFGVKLREGRFWTKQEAREQSRVILIDADVNQRLFGGQGLGQQMWFAGRQFEVVGVIDPFEIIPRVYDISTPLAFTPKATVYIPFSLIEPLELRPDRSAFAWKPHEPGFAGWLASEDNWIDFWVKLDAEAHPRYLAFLERYIQEQRRGGRLTRDMELLRNCEAWIEIMDMLSETEVVVIFALVFFVACILNFMGLLLAKFQARTNAVGIHRALGASRWHIFLQHLGESLLYGAFASLLGVIIALPILAMLNHHMPALGGMITLRLWITGFCIVACMIITLLGGLYPAWRISRTPPAMTLQLTGQ